MLDTYNESEVGGGVTNTLSKSPTTVVAGAVRQSESAFEHLNPPPDGFRYAACGDGVAAPVAEWIGRRLLAVMRGEAPDDPKDED